MSVYESRRARAVVSVIKDRSSQVGAIFTYRNGIQPAGDVHQVVSDSESSVLAIINGLIDKVAKRLASCAHWTTSLYSAVGSSQGTS